MMMNSIILFLPETGIYPYLRGLCTISTAITNNRKNIYLLHCTGQFAYCNMMSMSGIRHDYSYAEKKNICKKCHVLFEKARSEYALNFLELNKIIQKETVDELTNKIPNNIDELMSFHYEGIPIGKIASIDLFLKIKCMDIHEISPYDKILYKKYVLNVLIGMKIMHFICANIFSPLFITYNPYSICVLVNFISKKNGLPFTYITNNHYMGANFSQFLFVKHICDMGGPGLMKYFGDRKTIPIPVKYVRYSWSDSIFRFYGSDGHVYSEKKTVAPEKIIKSLHLSKQKKIAVAFTSSNDEILGIYQMYGVLNERPTIQHAFLTQVDWLYFLREYANKHTDVQIIVRVHPREGVKRGGFASEHLLLLQDNFRQCTDNFIIIWPDDPISSYDLMELADICLVNWSTMGLECARVGIPVLSYTDGSSYVNSRSFMIAHSILDYKKKLDELFSGHYTFDILTDAIRYNYWRNFLPVIDCGDTVSPNASDESIWPRLSDKMACIVNDIFNKGLNPEDYNMKNWFSSIDEKSELDEKIEILKGIAYFYHTVFINSRNRFINHLFLQREVRYPDGLYFSLKKKSCLASFLKRKAFFSLGNNNMVYYSYNGKVYKRYSPLLFKLGFLYKEQMKDEDVKKCLQK